MSYLYIFDFISLDDIVLVGVTDNWNEKLESIKNDSRYQSDVEKYAVYEIDTKAKENTLSSIQSMLSKAHVFEDIYRIPKDKIKALLDSIILIIDDIETKSVDADRIDVSKFLTEEQNESIPRENYKNDDEFLIPEDISPVRLKELLANHFRKLGYTIHYSHLTLSSLNKNGNYCWSNAPIEYLNYDWSLIINDKSKRIAYLFDIKANSYSSNDFLTRNDENREHCMQLEIELNSGNFVDTHSGTSFGKHKIGQFTYHIEGADSKPINGTISHEPNVMTSVEPSEPTIYKYVLGEKTRPPSSSARFKPVSCTFMGKTIAVDAWADILNYVLSYLCDLDPIMLRHALHNKKILDLCCFIFSMPNKDDTNKYTEISDTKIYFRNDVDPYEMAIICKSIFGKSKFDIPYSEFSFEYKDEGCSPMTDDEINELIKLLDLL